MTRGSLVLAADLAVKVATVALLAWAVANPDLPQFHGKAFTARAVVYPLALVALPILWRLTGARIPYPLATDLLLGLPFLIDTAGNALNLYDTVAHWDDLNHFVNWSLHTGGIALLLRYGPWGFRTRVALGFCWAVTSAVLWEFGEYVTFVPGSPEAATAYRDTLFDIANGMLGGLLASLLIGRLPALTVGRSAGSDASAGEPLPRLIGQQGSDARAE